MPAIYNSLRAQRRGLSLGGGYYDENGNYLPASGNPNAARATSGNWPSAVQAAYLWIESLYHRGYKNSISNEIAKERPDLCPPESNGTVRIDCSGGGTMAIWAYWIALKNGNGGGFDQSVYDKYIAKRYRWTSASLRDGSGDAAMNALGWYKIDFSVSGLKAWDLLVATNSSKCASGHVKLLGTNISGNNWNVWNTTLDSSGTRDMTNYKVRGTWTASTDAQMGRSWKYIWRRR